ncbi:MAG: hypothetical protein A2X35_07860 [Elusimicrobia bacterium GWA2_61_42]|nr:MAG: hypothetical protein A2X35_07860 [Elusimicrobia bacterium GWA2_61_42]OGR76011.1 MAG: hypothetical protein A2X38_08170 [Elusimicrobia bacterium GWC2_61_25]
MKAGALGLLALLSFRPGFLGAQNIPLDDKARYEKAQEQKMDEVLLKLLGPNQAKVIVQATMDFTRTEKFDVTSGGVGTAGKGGMFKWESASTDAGQPLNEYLLPGFPAMEAAEGEKKSYQKQLIFPASFIKKLTVSVILNKTMSEADSQNVRSVVSEVMGLNAERGDELTIIKTPFAPAWRTIWYTPEAVSLIFKYGILSVIGIIALVVVAIGFLKLAGAMNTMAKAQQSHQITMDMGKSMAGMGGGGPPLPGLEKLDLSGLEKKDAEGGGEPGASDSLVFNVKPAQVDFLVNLMAGEDPANVALVAGHLPEEVKTEFLRKLPAEVSMEVISNMARVRFVEPDVIITIREELEKRLAGAFGGVSKVIEALSRMNLRAKREMLDSLQARHPDIAREVRPRVFLPEDLMKFSDKELSMLASYVKVEDWALALWDFPQGFKERLKTQLTDKTWAMLEQTMKYGAPSAGKTEAAVEAVVVSALKLISDGRVANPLSAVPELNGSEPAAAGPGKGGTV